MEKLKISQIMNSKTEQNYRIVILSSELDSNLVLAIMVEAKQVEQLEIAWRKLPYSRPYTADFMSEALQGGGVQLEQIVIEKVENNTFLPRLSSIKLGAVTRLMLVQVMPWFWPPN